MLVRFDIRPDRDGWTIYDRTTDQPAVIDGFVSEALLFEDADDLVDLLNTLDVLKRHRPASSDGRPAPDGPSCPGGAPPRVMRESDEDRSPLQRSGE